MLYKIISIILIGCLNSQNLINPMNQLVYKNTEYANVEPQDDTPYKHNDEPYRLIQYLPEENIKLFALKSCHYPGTYDQFLLSINDSRGVFHDWHSTTSKTREPKLILSDLNGDKVDELIIVLTYGTGSGIHEEEVHVININPQDKNMYFDEYMLTDPFIIIKENITSKITEREKDVLIKIKVNDNEYNIKMDNIHPGMWGDKVGFGGKIYWRVNENKLYAYIDVGATATLYVGTVIIEYKFNSENEFFNLGKITFQEDFELPPED
ncbi:hypothetical protein [Oceanirhabdus seepicola]|uniref:Uncharacterized protein n=1 Tax=Oceanirhabdus seepicola TaxID=2828781 RepID=A0A9J6NWZ0_9CLOT|nr:hypothetical protein [Oceanirhabdus seepicola]MCM1988970.1 hypothetical protein [Oceanirhabdus seepicola]